MKIEYSSNNSGGSWWLTDENWVALEEAGWTVEWGRLFFCHSSYPSLQGKKPEGLEVCESEKSCSGHRAFQSHTDMTDNDRWLGGLAQAAWKEVDNIADAIREFEKVANQDATAQGCNCCGEPHNFSWTEDDGEKHYLYGEDILPILFGDGPKTLREAYEEKS